MKSNDFKPGDVVLWDPGKNSNLMEGTSEEDKLKYWEDLGYGSKKPHFFVFLCEISRAPRHCVLVSLVDQTLRTMIHTDELRLATEAEF